MSDLGQALGEYKKRLDGALKLYEEIRRLDQQRGDHVAQLRSRVNKLVRLIEELDQAPLDTDGLRHWVGEYEPLLSQAESELRVRFGRELEAALAEKGFPLRGQYPELKSGLFTLQLDFVRGKATVWYGPKQERLEECPLRPADMASRLEGIMKRLGSGIPEPEFLGKLRQAYARQVSAAVAKGVPITAILGEVAHLVQDARFHQDPRKELYRSYGRADFSYDLFRLTRFLRVSPSDTHLRLAVATREYTKRRQDFLWVPDDESGKGTAYSHLRFEGEMP
ncbi:MAG: hypothetical protein QME70_03990 [Bacillota bacterium]|nr:hypothetical protein [Bacillota bacterium]